MLHVRTKVLLQTKTLSLRFSQEYKAVNHVFWVRFNHTVVLKQNHCTVGTFTAFWLLERHSAHRLKEECTLSSLDELQSLYSRTLTIQIKKGYLFTTQKQFTGYQNNNYLWSQILYTVQNSNWDSKQLVGFNHIGEQRFVSIQRHSLYSVRCYSILEVRL